MLAALLQLYLDRLGSLRWPPCKWPGELGAVQQGSTGTVPEPGHCLWAGQTSAKQSGSDPLMGLK